MKRLAIFLATALVVLNLQAQVNSVTSGKWHDPTTWDTGVPISTDDVVIATGHTVTYNALHPSADNDETVNTLTVDGTLSFPFAATADDADLDADFILRVTGDVTIASTGRIDVDNTYTTGQDRDHQLLVSGDITNNGVVDMIDAAISATIITMNANSAFTIAGGTLDTDATTNNSFAFNGSNSALTINDGTAGAVVNFGTGLTTNTNAIRVNADGITITVNNSGGNVNIGNAGVGEGQLTLTASATNFTFNQQDGTTNIADRFNLNAAADVSLNVSGGELQVGVGNTAANNSTFRVADALSLTGGHLNFGETLTIAEDLLIDGATLSTNSNSGNTGNFTVPSGITLTAQEGSTIEAQGGLSIVGTLIVQGDGAGGGTASTVNIRSEIGAGDNLTGTEFVLNGELDILDGSSVNVAPNANGSVSTLLIDLQDGSASDEFDLVDGSFNVLPAFDGTMGTISVDILQMDGDVVFDFDEGSFVFLNALTDQSAITGGELFQVNGNNGANQQILVGDGSGTAIFSLAPNLLPDPIPTPRNFINVLADDSRFIIESDAQVQIGGSTGNIGDVYYQDENDFDLDYHLDIRGGTVNISGTLDINEGNGVTISGGVVNIGINASNGRNTLELGGANPDGQTVFEITGPATVSVGDGASSIIIGNNNSNPGFNDTDEYHEIEVTGGGTLNINGGFLMSDVNARFVFGGGSTINLNPQAENLLASATDIFSLTTGVVQLSGSGSINILNPHAISGSGVALEINPVGGNSTNTISSTLTGDDPVDFSNITFSFGDGSESSDGSADGFDVDLSTDNGQNHTFGAFVINNPSGSNREVYVTNSGETFSTGSITISAGTLDLGTNDYIDNGTVTAFTLGANSTLQLDADFPGTGGTYDSYSIGTGSTVHFNGTSTISAVESPSAENFYNLIFSGTGNKTLGAALSILETLTLTDGTFVTGSNLTMGSGSTISISDGAFQAGVDIQGTNDYTIEYTGSGKAIDITTAPEWTGGGNFDLIVNLDAAQDLTISGSQLSLENLTITQGNLTDASAGFVHDVASDLSVSGAYTGLGKIRITGGSATHNLSSSGTASFSNFEIDDATYNATGNIDMIISGTLDLTNGLLELGSGSMTLASGATFTGGSATSYVAFDGLSSSGGMTQTYLTSAESRTFPIGISSAYTRAIIELTAASGFGELTVIPVNSGSVFTLDGGVEIDLDYHWQVTTDGSFTGVTVNHTYYYDEANVRGVEGNYLAARYNVSSPSWDNSDDSADLLDGVDDTNNIITLTGVEYIDGHFTAGESDEFSGVITTFYPRSDLTEPLDWNDPSSWTNTDGGTTPINRVPGTNSPVVVNRIVQIDDDAQSSGSLTIEAAGELIIGENGSGSPASNHTFGTVSGAGQLTLVSDDAEVPVYPNENGTNLNNFLNNTSSTIQFDGDGSYTIPNDVSTFQNLIITSTTGSTKTLPDLNLTINNDFTLSGGNSTVVNISDATNGDISIGNDLTIDATNTLTFPANNIRDLTVGNDITATGTLNVSGSGSITHTLSLSGTLDATSGTVDFNTGGSVVDVTFGGSSNEMITGTGGSVDFNRLVVDKGTDQTATLTADVSTLTITDTGSDILESSLELVNGTFILSTNGTFTVETNGDFTIPSTAKLWLASGSSPTVQMTSSNAGTFFLSGDLQVSGGIVNVGTQTDQTTTNDIRYDASGTEIIVDGGILNVGGAIRPTVTDASAIIDFTLSSGTVSIARNTSTTQLRANSNTNRNNADFAINNASSSFTMTGGTLEVIRPDATDGKAISISALVTNYTVSGGTLNIARDAHDAFSSNNTNQNRDIGLYSNAPFWNVQLGDGDYAGDIGNARDNNTLDFIVLNDLTINLNDASAGEGNFDLFRVDQGSGGGTGMNLEVGGSFTITDGTFNVLDDGTDGTVTFIGSGLAGQTNPQLITSNSQILGDINVNNTNGAGSVQLADNLEISGDWTYTNGTLNQATYSITMGNSNGVATVIYGTASFDDLVLENTNEVSLGSDAITINSGGSLTLADDVILDLGDYGLTINENTNTGIAFVATADATNMIRTSGTTSAAGITWAFSGTGSTYTFPVGVNVAATDYYTPADINLSNDGGGGSITVSPIAGQHPQADDTEDALQIYWRLSDSGFSPAGSFDFTYPTAFIEEAVDVDSDTDFTGSHYDRDGFTWTSAIDITPTGDNTANFTMTTLDDLNSDFTAGNSGVFNSPVVFYTTRSGDWDNTSSGTTPWASSCGGAEIIGVQPSSLDPVVICSGHTVTITTATGLAASSIQIDGQLTSQIADITSINDIDGTGTLAFTTISSTPSFGTLSGTFTGASGGTVDYGGGGTYTLPTQASYNNLTISNSNLTTLGANVTVRGDVTFNGPVDMGGFTLSDADGDGTFTLSAGTSLEIDAANNFPDNFNTYSLDATSTTDYSFDNSSVQTVYGGITYGNLDISRTGGDPAQKGMAGNITVLGDLTIDRRAELISNDYTLTLEGDWTRDNRNNTDFDEGTGTVIFAGTNDQTISMTGNTAAETFYNLTINKGSGTVDIGGGINGITITNDLTVTSGTLDFTADPITVGGNFSTGASGIYSDDDAITIGGNLTNAGQFTLPNTVDIEGDLNNSGTFTVASTVSLNGDFTNTGTYTTTSNTLVLDNAVSAQSFNGNTTTFNNLTLAKANGVDATSNIALTIAGTLALQNEGNLILSSGNLTIETTASITGNAGGTTRTDFSADRMIRTAGGSGDPLVVKEANVAADWDILFPIGVDDGGNTYTPVLVDATNDNITSGTLSVRSINGSSTDEAISSAAETLDRFYHFNVTGLTGNVIFDVLFDYVNADVQGTEGDYSSAYSEISNADGWIQPNVSVSNVDAANNRFGATGANTITFGADISTEWIAGNNDLLFPRLYPYATNCNPGPCNWSDNLNWSLSDDGSTQDGFQPTADNGVTILASSEVLMDANTEVSADIEVLGTLDFAGTSGHALGDLTGTGTVSLTTNGLDNFVNTGSGSTFFDDGGGTVEYTGNSNYTLPSAITEYYSLSINGTTVDTHDKELGVNTVVLGDLNITNVDLENAGNYSLELRGSFGASGGGSFELRDGNFIWANTVTASLSSDIVFGSASDLTLDNFGEKDLAGTLNLNNLIINSSSGTFDANSNNINLTGDWDNRGTTNKLSNPATTTFNGGLAQQLDGDNTFGALTVDLASTVLTINSGDNTFGGAVTVSNNAVFNLTGDNTFSGAVSIDGTSSAINIADGTQTFNNTITLTNSGTFNLGSNTARIGNTMDVDAGTFMGGSGTLVYTSASDPEVQTDPITVLTLEVDKGTNNTLDNDGGEITFTNLVITSGEYDGTGAAIPGFLQLNANAEVEVTEITSIDVNQDVLNYATIDLSSLTNIFIGGNYTDNGAVTLPATVTFDGAGAQSLNTPLTVDNFVKDGGGDLTLNADLTVNLSLTLTDGDIISSPTNILSMDAAAAEPVGSDGSHVVGTMRWPIASTSQRTLWYPLGDGTTLRTLELDLTQTASTFTWYTASQFTGAPTTRTNTGSIDHVSVLRYYNVTASNDILASGASNRIRFIYQPDDGVVDQNNLLVAKSDTDVADLNWIDLGGTILSGDANSGEIESTVDFSSFSDIVLASNTPEASLPVELVNFQAIAELNTVKLTWLTASEVNNDYFVVEKSLDGQDFYEIGRIDGSGNSNELTQYEARDTSPTIGTTFYRLAQVDFNGDQVLFDPVQVNYSPNGLGLVTLHPNPTNYQNINIQFNRNKGDVRIKIYDLTGQIIFDKEFDSEKGTVPVNLQNSLPAGLYNVTIESLVDSETQKLVIL